MNLIPRPVERDTDQRFVIRGANWQMYEKFLTAIGDRRIFATYDGRSLELMSPSPLHEMWKCRLGRFLPILAEELNIPHRGYGSSTWKREDLERGLEADESFYFQNVSAVLGKIGPDLTKDPPPDLAIEIDISPSALDRESIHAGLGVPEIWCCDGNTLRVYCLGPERQYHEKESSPTFPWLDLKALVALIQPNPDIDDTAESRIWRAWIRKNVLPKLKKGKASKAKPKRKPKR